MTRFEILKRQVQRCEHRLEANEQRTRGSLQLLRQAWRDGWTPGRIVIAGLVSGFLTGRAEPLRSLTGARWLQMIGSLSGMLASLQAAAAASNAEDAADEAAEAAGAGEAPSETPLPEEPLVDERYDDVVAPPIAAAAATDLSER